MRLRLGTSVLANLGPIAATVQFLRWYPGVTIRARRSDLSLYHPLLPFSPFSALCPLLPAASGLLNVDKPAGITSRDAVDLVQRLARPAKVGHAGTLDPLATGVLVICVGAATRLIEYVQRMPKRYVGTFLLGRSSATEDIDGPVTLLPDPPIPTAAEIEAAARKFVGTSPAAAADLFGAEGRPANGPTIWPAAARRWSLKPRPIEVYSLKVARYDYPELVLEIECSGGTYVRSLGRDLAESLGTAAVMSALVRTAIGPWTLDTAVDPRTLTAADWQARLDPLRKALSALPVPRVNSRRGRAGASRAIHSARCAGQSQEIAAVDASGRLVAILVPRSPGQWGRRRIRIECRSRPLGFRDGLLDDTFYFHVCRTRQPSTLNEGVATHSWRFYNASTGHAQRF